MGITERRSMSLVKTTFKILISIILIAIQLVVYYWLFIGAKNIPYIVTITTIIGFCLVIRLYNSNDNIGYKLTWTILILLFNFTGPVFYLCFGGGRNLPNRKNKKIKEYLEEQSETKEENFEIKELKEDRLGYRAAKLISSKTLFYPYQNQGEEFFYDGAVMFEAMLREIDKAEKYIFLEYFIVASGVMFDELVEHLEAKAKAGVEVKFIYDFVGSNIPKVLKKKDMARLSSIPNLTVCNYNPLGTNLNFGINYRDHRKILLIDGICAFVGGINIADEYIHKKEKYGFWRDNGMLIRGEACYNYLIMFVQNWYMSTRETIDVKNYKGAKIDAKSSGFVMPFGDGPCNRENPAYDLFMYLILNAKESILISTPYFIIDKQFIKLLIDQIKSGVEVKILFPEIADKKIAYTMAQNNIDSIAAAGGKVYKLKGGFNHAKTIVVDGKYGVCGTINIDYRSLFLHFECANFLINTPAVKDIEKDFLETTAKLEPINLEDIKKVNIFKRVFAAILSLIGPLF